jgi:hypothetical protein
LARSDKSRTEVPATNVQATARRHMSSSRAPAKAGMAPYCGVSAAASSPQKSRRPVPSAACRAPWCVNRASMVPRHRPAQITLSRPVTRESRTHDARHDRWMMPSAQRHARPSRQFRPGNDAHPTRASDRGRRQG